MEISEQLLLQAFRKVHSAQLYKSCLVCLIPYLSDTLVAAPGDQSLWTGRPLLPPIREAWGYSLPPSSAEGKDASVHMIVSLSVCRTFG